MVVKEKSLYTLEKRKSSNVAITATLGVSHKPRGSFDPFVATFTK